MIQPRRGGFGTGGFGGFGGISFGSHLTPWVKRLLIANTIVFLAMGMGLLPPGPTVRWLGFANTEPLLRPWSWVTYMFVHGGFGHLFMNMLTLFFFGPPLERTWGGKYFIQYYVVAGLGGALFSLIFFPVIGPSTVIGASGAIFGLLLAFALNWPNAEIYLYFLVPVKAKWFVGFLGFINVYAMVSGRGGSTAYWAHLGGLATGFVYLRYGERIGSWFKKLLWKEKPRKVKVEPSTGPTASEKKPQTPRGRRKVNGDALDEVDRILDKIRASGMDSLTPKERAFLDEMSRRYQKRDTETKIH
jgi:membrane associated rhomboid family serine protease